MLEIFCILILFIPLILGLAELLHAVKLYILKPKKSLISYKIIFLLNENCVEQLLYAKERFLWQGRSENLNLILVNSALNEENFKICGEIAKKYGLIYCTAEELENYIRIISG